MWFFSTENWSFVIQSVTKITVCLGRSFNLNQIYIIIAKYYAFTINFNM